MRQKRAAVATAPAKKPALKAPQKLKNADRSALFSRREAAKVLRSVLLGDTRRQAVASIKSLVFSPSVRNKKATFALVCQTLKHLQIIKEVLEIANVLTCKWKCGGFSSEATGTGLHYRIRHPFRANISKPRYVRVNTLKMDVDSAIHELSKIFEVRQDNLVPDLLMLPPGSDLHDHPLVSNGSLVLQGKASSMVAVALGPNPGWRFLDACAAPGNKTVHIAALVGGKGKIIACELNEERAKRLENTVRVSGASNIKVVNGDFLSLNPNDHPYSKVRAILLDPSCSGSGTASDRLDHLLPSFAGGEKAPTFSDIERLNKLSAFQKKALSHALSFPGVERVVYSTCSINQAENEDVVAAVLPLAESCGFQLGAALPQWPRRGLPVVEGSEHLVRTDPVEDKEGFFIALFVRKLPQMEHNVKERGVSARSTVLVRKKSQGTSLFSTKLSKMLLQSKRFTVMKRR